MSDDEEKVFRHPSYGMAVLVTAAKAEIEAFATNRIVAAGLKALTGGDDDPAPRRELGSGTKF